jgi:hypothetical protein
MEYMVVPRAMTPDTRYQIGREREGANECMCVRLRIYVGGKLTGLSRVNGRDI